MPDTSHPSRPNMGHISTDDLTRELCERFARRSATAADLADRYQKTVDQWKNEIAECRERQRILDAKIAALTGTDRWADDAHDQITNNLGRMLADYKRTYDVDQGPVCDHCGKAVRMAFGHWIHVDDLHDPSATCWGKATVNGKRHP